LGTPDRRVDDPRGFAGHRVLMRAGHERVMGSVPSPAARKSVYPFGTACIIGIWLGRLIVVAMLLSCNLGSPPTPPTTLIETDDLSVAVPSGWQLESKTSSVITVYSKHGNVRIGVRRMGQPLTLDQLIQGDLANASALDRNARICGGPLAARMPNGPADGQAVVFCYVYPPQNGEASFEAAELWFEAVNSDATINFAIRLFTTASNYELFVHEALPVIGSVHWKVSAPVGQPSYAPPPNHVPLCLPSGPGGGLVCGS
jgi:hypothetical protein